MVILNRVVNILILLAAIAAVVFSYLLFGKREKLVDGWGKMASAITTAAKAVDDGGASGTSAVKDLAADKLKHTNYEQLDQVLPKLKDNISKVIAQRNELSGKMAEAAGKLSIPKVNAKDLKNVAAYKDQERIFLNGVSQFVDNRNKISNEYAGTFRKFGVSVSPAELSDPRRMATAVNKGNMRVSDIVSRKNSYENFIRSMARTIGVQAPKISTPAYVKELNKLIAAVNTKNRELKTAKQKVARLENENKVLRRKMAAAGNDLKKFKAELKEKDNIISKNGEKPTREKFLREGDPECYKYVRGIIEYVDKDYGFVTINIGKNYSILQPYGAIKNYIPYSLKKGTVLTVVRDFNSSNPLFIAKIVVTKVDETSSVCNLVSGKPELIQEGDSVQIKEEDARK